MLLKKKLKKARPEKKSAQKKKASRVAIGFDTSPSVISGCGMAFDGTFAKAKGPVWVERRWQVDTPWEERMKEAAKGHEIVLDILHLLDSGVRHLDDIYIGVESPWGYSFAKGGMSRSLKQQAQVHGSLYGSLLRYGYKNIEEVDSRKWKGVVAFDLDKKQNKEFTKWDVKEWAQEVYPDIPDWPDLIRTKNGLISKPEKSKARPAQPNDFYDATGIMTYVWDSIKP